MARVTPSKDGFTVRGLLPPGLRGAPDPIKLTFWSFALAAVLKEKDRELAAGLNKDGRELRKISPQTRKYRRSAMTPTGKGDPSAPPLTPGRALSRTRSLLTGKAFVDKVEIWWRYDPYTYDSWARVLRRQRRQGRDVFGLSSEGLARATANAWRDFGRWQQGRRGAKPPPPSVQPAAAPGRAPDLVGTTRMTWATTEGIGAVPHAVPGTTGGLTWPQWIKRLRQPAPPPPVSPTAPAGRARFRPFNVLLRLIFGS